MSFLFDPAKGRIKMNIKLRNLCFSAAQKFFLNKNIYIKPVLSFTTLEWKG